MVYPLAEAFDVALHAEGAQVTHCRHLCEGDYLIDDRGKNGASEFKGEWIQFGSDRFADWKSVLSYLLG